MSLRVWLPLDGNLRNLGISKVDIISGAAAYGAGKISGSALSYINSTTNLELYCEKLNNVSTFSICFWAKSSKDTSDTDWASPIHFGVKAPGSSTINKNFRFGKDNRASSTGYPIGVFHNSGNIIASSNHALTTSADWDTWVHISFICDGTHVVGYKNGIQVFSNNNGQNGILSGNIYLCLERSNSYINDLRIYDHCLSAAEVHEISQGLVLHYKLDDITNGIKDSSGYGHNGNITGSLQLNSTPRYSAASVFNGTESIIADTPQADIRTLSCWCKTTKNKSTSQFVVADSSSGMVISFYKGNIIGVFGTTRSTGSKSILGDSYKENDWNHIVVVKTDDAGSRNIYCNGVKLTPTTNDYWSAASGFFVGARNTSTALPFYGSISDVRAYCTAFNDDEVMALYHTSAKVDNKQKLHTFELVENSSKISINKQGQTLCKELTENTDTKFYKTNQAIDTAQIIEF